MALLIWVLVALIGLLNGYCAIQGYRCSWGSYFCLYACLVATLAKYYI